eukprot:31215-Pelagococcus_subviridis.AAC.6
MRRRMGGRDSSEDAAGEGHREEEERVKTFDVTSSRKDSEIERRRTAEVLVRLGLGRLDLAGRRRLGDDVHSADGSHFCWKVGGVCAGGWRCACVL